MLSQSAFLRAAGPLLCRVMRRDVFLGFRVCLTDALFVVRLDYLAAAGLAFIEELVKEVAISVFVENQFTLAGRGVGLGGMHLK